MNDNIRWITGSTVKWIAVVTMLIDHIGAVLFPQYMIFRVIGRVAFPLFCFLLVEGYVHTGNVKKYMGRLLLFAFIAEIPFNLALRGQIFAPDYQNVFWTLLLGMIVLWLVDHLPQKWMGLAAGIGIMLVAHVVNTDYAAGGILLIFVLYWFREKELLRYIVMALVLILGYGGVEIVGLIAIVPMAMYNGQRGRHSMKYFFYVFYPAHLLVLYLIGRFLI